MVHHGATIRHLRQLLLWLCMSASVAPAHAAEGVLLWEASELRPGLCTALRIQLSDLATVRCQSDPTSASGLTERIQNAAGQVAAQGATLGVLLERDPDPSRVRMYLIAGRVDQAVIAIEQIENRPEPDIDRSLALKVRDALDVMERYAAVAGPRTAALAALIAPSAPMAPDTPRWALFADAGGALSAGTRTRAAGLVALGVQHSAGALRAELGGTLRKLSETQQRSDAGQVDEREWAAGLTLRGLWLDGRWALGAYGEPVWNFMHAEGRTATGTRGSAQVSALSWTVGLDLRVRVSDTLWLRLAPAAEFFAVAQGFALDDRVTLKLGRARALIPLTLGVALPFRRSP